MKKKIQQKPLPAPGISRKPEESVSPAWYAKTPFWLKITLFAFAFVLYGNTLQNGYSLDDLYVTYNNPVVSKGIKAIPQILSTRYINVNAEEGGMMNFGYRPLTKVMFALEHQLFGESPSTSHLINILLYGLSLLLLFSVLRKLMQQYSIWFPFFICLLWAAHPVHTEVVASLKNREEIISFLFALLALWFYISYATRNSIPGLVFGAVFFLMSFFSKTSTIPLLAAIPFTIYFFTKAEPKKLLFIIGSLLLVVLTAIVFLRLTLPPGNRPMLYFENPLAFEKHLLLRISTGMYGLLMYLKLLVYPHPLLFYYGYNSIPMVGLLNPWVILSILVHIALFVFAVMKFREKHILSFAILFYLTVISMYSNIIKPPAGIIAERFLYIASLGFCIGIIFLLFKLLRIPLEKVPANGQISKIFLVLLVILIPYTARTVVRNKDWKSQLSLFSHDINYLHDSAKANYIYATTLKTDLIEKLKEDGSRSDIDAQADKIIGLLKQTVKVYPGYFEAWNSLGEMNIMILKDYSTAVECFQKAAETRPRYAPAWFNMGYVYQLTGKYPEAIRYYRHAMVLDSTDLKTLSNLGACYNKNNQLDSAVYVNEQILVHKPGLKRPYLNIVSYFLEHSDTTGAIPWLLKIDEMAPGDRRVVSVLYRYFKGKGDAAKTEHYKAILVKMQQSNTKPDEQQKPY